MLFRCLGNTQTWIINPLVKCFAHDVQGSLSGCVESAPYVFANDTQGNHLEGRHKEHDYHERGPARGLLRAGHFEGNHVEAIDEGYET